MRDMFHERLVWVSRSLFARSLDRIYRTNKIDAIAVVFTTSRRDVA
jgi:hypothetical protein